MRAIIWTAVSSEAQAAEDKVSLPEQERQCRAWADSQGARVIDTLSVNGFSRSESDIITMLDELAAQGCYAYHSLRRHWQARDFDVLIAYADDRLGRSSTAISYVIENTIKAGAKIFLLQGGLVDKTSHRFRIAMSGVNVSQQIDQLVERRAMAMDRRARDGYGASPKPLFIHEIPRNEYGKRVGKLRVKGSMRRLLDDLAELLLEGLPFRELGAALYARGHVTEKGEPYDWCPLWRMLHHPYTWGHSALRFNSNKQRVMSRWSFDASEAPPPGVIIYYNTHEPAYTGEMARRVQAELKRRSHIKGHSSPRLTHRFSALLACDDCHDDLNYQATIRRGIKHPRYRCTTRSNGGVCHQHKSIREHEAQAAIDRLLRAVIGLPNALEALLGNSPKKDNSAGLEALQKEIAAVESQIGQLIYSESTAPANVRGMYTEQITRASERLKALNVRLQTVERGSMTARRREDMRQTLASVLMDLEAFWARDDRSINQALHAIFSGHKFMVRDGRIIALESFA